MRSRSTTRPASPPTNPAVACAIGGSTRFMRKSDCLSQGGRPRAELAALFLVASRAARAPMMRAPHARPLRTRLRSCFRSCAARPATRASLVEVDLERFSLASRDLAADARRAGAAHGRRLACPSHADRRVPAAARGAQSGLDARTATRGGSAHARGAPSSDGPLGVGQDPARVGRDPDPRRRRPARARQAGLARLRGRCTTRAGSRWSTGCARAAASTPERATPPATSSRRSGARSAWWCVSPSTPAA